MKELTTQNIYYIFSKVFNSDDFKKLSNLNKRSSQCQKALELSLPLKISEQQIIEDNRINETIENHLFMELKEVLFKEICHFVYDNNDVCELGELNKLDLKNKVILGGGASLVKITNTNNKVLDYNKGFGDNSFVVSDKITFDLDINSLNIVKKDSYLILSFRYDKKL